MIEALRNSFVERAEDGSPPEGWERAAVHVLYLGSAVLCLRAVSGLAGIARPLRADAFGQLLLISAACLAFSFWGAFRRTPPCQAWFASHLLWLTLTYAVLAGVFVAGLLVIGVLWILALVIPAIAFLMHGPLALAWLFTAWFAWRLLRGYPAFLRRSPIGAFERT
ncbi:MAG: hypothetical protein PVH00_03925 [Gemmatimonadota bacterium]